MRNTLSSAKHILVVVLLTAFAGATLNTVYEYIFRKEFWSAGTPVARWAFAVAVASPFILAALLVIGLPTTWLLAKLRAEGPIQYATVGTLGGLAFWPAIVVPWSWFDDVTSSPLPDSIAPLPLIAVTALYGLACAVLWFLIARRKHVPTTPST
jgi:hypothetical protein